MAITMTIRSRYTCGGFAGSITVNTIEYFANNRYLEFSQHQGRLA